MSRFGIVALSLGGVALVGTAIYFLARRKHPGRGKRNRPRMVGQTKAGDMTLSHYFDKDMPIQQRAGLLQDSVWKNVQNPQLRELALAITGCGKRNVTVGKYTIAVDGACCRARDGRCEARAIYDWTKNNVRYTGDVAPVKMGRNGEVEGIDLFQGPLRTVEFGGGDCLPGDTLLLTEGHRFVPIDEMLIGTRIWGRDKWTEVKDVWCKGTLPVDAVFLNNGSSFKATSDHKIYVAICRHEQKWDDDMSKRCSCPMSSRSIERIRLADARPGMVVVTPERISYGTDESLSSEKALIEGMYLADGWCSHDSSFDIAGRDGHPKEEQKKTIEEICNRLGMPTYWHEKYIRIKDKEWTQRVSQMGNKAWMKHALSIDLPQESAKSLLQGIMADSGANTKGNGRTFTTTSRELMLQVRTLYKMLGQTCSERYIPDHGGLGTHPIWRLGVRDTERSDGHAEKLLRIKDIERGIAEMPVYDLTTEDHYVYLPEADVTVSNCDDHAVLNSTLLILNGIPSNFRITSPRRFEDWAHIYSTAGLPKTDPDHWVALDTTVPGEFFGREAPAAKKIDFTA